MALEDSEKKKEYYKKWLTERKLPVGRCSYGPKEGYSGTYNCGMYAHVDLQFREFTCLSAAGNTVSGYDSNLKVEPCEHKRLKDLQGKQSS